MSEKYAHNLCRLCLYKSHNLIDIFGDNGRHGYIAAEVIKDLLQITVQKFDGFPQNVCSICLDKLTDFKVFKDQCLECKTSFEQEFSLDARSNQPKAISVPPEQESVSSNQIKVEVKTEAEIIEIPADDLVMRDVSPSPTELDVETVDDDVDIMYVDSGDDIVRRNAGSSPRDATHGATDLESRPRDSKGKCHKTKKRKRGTKEVSSNCVGDKRRKVTIEEKLEAIRRIDSGESATTIASEMGVGKSTVGDWKRNREDIMKSYAALRSGNSVAKVRKPTTDGPPGNWEVSITPGIPNAEFTGESRIPVPGKTTTSKDNSTENTPAAKRRSKGNASVQNHADILRCLLNRARKENSIRSDNWECDNRVAADTEKVTVNRTDNNVERKSDNVSPYFATPENANEESQRVSVDSESCSGEHTTLRKRNTHPYTYNEDNFLLSGDNIQGYVDLGRWSPDTSPKKRKKQESKAKSLNNLQRVMSPSKNTKFVTQRSNDESHSDCSVSADGIGVVGDKNVDVEDQSLDDMMRKDYTCLVCSKVFVTKAACANHRKSHPKMPFSCNVCDKTFYTLDKLKTHKLKHSGFRPFGCNICTKAYTRLSHLTRHLLVHTRPSGDSS